MDFSDKLHKKSRRSGFFLMRNAELWLCIKYLFGYVKAIKNNVALLIDI